MKDKQPRKPSNANAPLDKLHPSSDMGKRAKGGDKFSTQGHPRRMKGGEQAPASPSKPKPR